MKTSASDRAELMRSCHGGDFRPARGVLVSSERVLWSFALTLAVVSFIGLPGIAAATPSSPNDIGCEFILGQGGWTVRWQARTPGGNGAFHLYAGRDIGSLRVVDMQEAAGGVASYQFEDTPDGSAWLFYQLRYVSNDGDERVLGTLRVEIDGMEDTPATYDLGSWSTKALRETRPYFTLVSARHTPLDTAALLEGAVPEPEVPPPRPTISL